MITDHTEYLLMSTFSEHRSLNADNFVLELKAIY